jgi:hypothetical protein
MSTPVDPTNREKCASGLGETLGHSLIERIGNTPLLRLDALTADLPGVALLGKAEWYNPGGSVKDRAAANIVAEARRRGQLGPGKILLDATSGNTGIAYAMLGAAEGFPVTLCMPENVSRERKQILHGYGANILYTDPADGSDGAIRMARELAAKHPDQYFYADQYSNEANWKAHYHGTANEIWQQTQGRSHALRLDARHQRHFRRHHAPAEGTESRGSMHLAAARLVVPRHRRRQAHGQRDRAENLRSPRSPIRISRSPPKTPTPWRASSRAPPDCWWESPPPPRSSGA